MTTRKAGVSLALLVVLLQWVVLGCASDKGQQQSNAATLRETRPGGIEAQERRKSVVTGSMIPQPVDKDGRPTESTTSVQVIDQKTINLVGGGSPSETLTKLPYAGRGGR